MATHRKPNIKMVIFAILFHFEQLKPSKKSLNC